MGQPKTLYINRPLLNAQDVIDHAKAQGFATTKPAGSMHMTQIYSKTPVDWGLIGSAPPKVVIPASDNRMVKPLGDGGAIVLEFDGPEFSQRWDELIAAGAKSDYPSFTCHTTLTWDGGDIDLGSIQPYAGELIFGPERFEEINADWKTDMVEKRFCEVVKVDSSLGLVFGWGIICKVGGEEYYDSHLDHIPEDVMVEASSDFMENSRACKSMHFGPVNGTLVHSFPLTTEIAKAMGIETKQTGWMVAMKPSDETVLQKFRSGEYSGFSIGGSGMFHEEN